jgi:two-component system, chemotaxis family, protein-glutamate methylesterase/glutaminase
MPFRVLVVDDSNFFQHRLKDIINEHSELKVVGIASNGVEAIEKWRALKPDIITMDFEMPVMDGITAIKHIMAEGKVPILMFSSLTYEGAKITLDALAAGALDYISKDFAAVSRNSVALKKKLHERLITLAREAQQLPNSVNNVQAPVATPSESRNLSAVSKLANRANAEASTPSPLNGRAQQPYFFKTQPKLLIIGASTGGPVALTDVLVKLPENFPLPIILVQHMPENFTTAFAERLDRQCNIRVREAVDGDILEAGLALLAPGGKQLMLDSRNKGSVRIFSDKDRVNYKPSLDVTFGSAANHFGEKVLGIVLTGMGADGCKGAHLLKEAGSSIWSQDQESSIVYGMPMAVARAGLTDRVLSLKEIGVCLVRELM